MKKIVRIRLIEERKRRRWSQQEVADLLGTTQHNVSRWESGITTPGPYFRAKLCELFGKQPQELGLFVEQMSEEQEHNHTPALDIPNTSLPVADQHSPLWNVPYPRNPFFTGREEILQHLHEMLSQKHTLTLTQSLAVSGLGGIGKTQIALEYAYRYRQEYRFVFWTNAATQETLLADFVDIVDCLQLPERKDQDQKKVLRAVKQWFATHYDWLLVLDNADEVAVVHDFVPTNSPGHLLLTSRAQALGFLAQRIEVEKMGMAEGTLFLLHRAKLLAPDASLDQALEEHLAAAEAIVIEMDFLPLPLDQAGAYIDEVGCSLSAYLDLYRTHRKELLQRRGHVPSDHPEPVTTTWSLSFQKIEQANPAAAELLRLCAFLEPDSIPEELLSEGSAEFSPVLQQITRDMLLLNEAIEELRKFSLVQRDPETRLLRVHRLVQAVQMDAMNPEEQRHWAERVVRAVNALFPREPKEDIASWPQCLRYLEQVHACDSLIQQHQLLLPEAADVLDRAGTYLRERGFYTLVEPLYQRALRIREQILGPEHPEVAASLCNLAILYRVQGIYEQAELFFQRARCIQEQTLESEHTDLAQTLNNLAALYRRRGMYEQAEPLFRRALSIWEQTVGPNHSLVASALTNLANLYREQGAYGQAEPLFQRSLHIFEQTVGPDHPRMAQALNNLAIFYSIQGMHEQAEPLFRRALRIKEQSLGLNHPEVATSLNNLANLYREQGIYDQAEPLLQRALRIREQSLGPDHPAVASSVHNLANLYREQGTYNQAEPLFQRSLRIREQTLAPHHPETAEVLHDFAVLREAQGNYQAAVSLYQRAFAIREQVLGHDHKHTRETRTKYLTLLQAMGRGEETDQMEIAQSE